MAVQPNLPTAVQDLVGFEAGLFTPGQLEDVGARVGSLVTDMFVDAAAARWRLMGTEPVAKMRPDDVTRLQIADLVLDGPLRGTPMEITTTAGTFMGEIDEPSKVIPVVVDSVSFTIGRAAQSALTPHINYRELGRGTGAVFANDLVASRMSTPPNPLRLTFSTAGAVDGLRARYRELHVWERLGLARPTTV